VIDYNDLCITSKWSYGGVGALKHGHRTRPCSF
jgi:hypothetical protein